MSVQSASGLGGSAMDISENVGTQPIALGPNQTARVSTEKTYVCILCQEEEKVSVEGATLVLAAFVQKATVLCQHRCVITSISPRCCQIVSFKMATAG